MSGSQWAMPALGVIGLVTFAALLFRAVSRREPRRVFDIIVSAAVLGVVVLQTLAPELLSGLEPAARAGITLVMLVFLANVFGLSGWLFRRMAQKRS